MTSSGILERIVYQAGESVFQEGDVGNRAYVVQEGLIEILRESADGAEVVLGSIEKGGIFGEMALIDDQPRMATAKAAAMTTVIVINREMFRKKLAKSDPFVRGLLGIFVKNIRNMVNDRINN
ncbi:MAG: Crp/Fnr family transcriptional regulator [Rhodospirillaceae bacterium]|jgi:CRP/FNR family cyclic AMP-dependent transcriptional regulator